MQEIAPGGRGASGALAATASSAQGRMTLQRSMFIGLFLRIPCTRPALNGAWPDHII
jgi:hypothetical protein